LLSTESGAATLVSLVNPEARLMSGWDERLRQSVGYVIPNELETNGRERVAIGSEIDMNRRCWRASSEIWRGMSWGSRARWVLVKWVTYWLSTDQLLNPGRISRLNRAMHVAAVVFYWALLVLAGLGLWLLRKSRPNVAAIFLGYVVLITILHTPFVMNSRIRAPLVDPLIAVLAGAGAVAILNGTVSTTMLRADELERQMNKELRFNACVLKQIIFYCSVVVISVWYFHQVSPALIPVVRELVRHIRH
jgi:hypothetical protein